MSLLRPASEDPFPSQRRTDWQPPAIVGESGEEEYDVEEILDERWKRAGRGRIHEYRVKWIGYSRPTWEPASAMEDTVALDRFEQRRRLLREGSS